MNAADIARIRTVLEAHATITLATSGSSPAGSGSGPWAATVFYASDPGLNIYFVSDERTRHGRDMSAGSGVAGAINRDVDSWDDVLGLQVEGEASVLDGEARDRALALYLAKFPDVARLFEAPRDEHERVIAARLRSTAFWQLAPRWIRVVDNGQGFGWKLEVTL